MAFIEASELEWIVADIADLLEFADLLALVNTLALLEEVHATGRFKAENCRGRNT